MNPLDTFDHKTLPHLRYIDERLYSKIVIEKVNTDAINGYGHLRSYSVIAYTVLRVCQTCGLTALSPYKDARYTTCPHHRWRKQLTKIAVGEGDGLPDALSDIERELVKYAAGEGRVLFEQFKQGGAGDSTALFSGND
jgi:hypothetical protein